jgi:chaperonin GroES
MPHYIALGAPETEEQTITGIILPDAIVKNQATVLAIGELVTACKVGDQVIYRPYAGDKIKYEDVPYLIVHEKELKAIVG